jgi:phosphatidylglycerol lysyltransferase
MHAHRSLFSAVAKHLTQSSPRAILRSAFGLNTRTAGRQADKPYERGNLAIPAPDVAQSKQFQPIELGPHAELPTLRNLAQPASDPTAWLVLQHDKSLLVDAFGNFIAFTEQSGCCIALRGAMGANTLRPDRERDLLTAFLTRAKKARAVPVFYQADAATLAAVNGAASKLAVGKGGRKRPFVAYKLGEEAVLALADFDLSMPAYSGIRYSVRKAEKAGLRFEFCAKANVEVLAQCAVISEEWLQARSTREKGFSLGRFYTPALLDMPLALVYDGLDLVAFANVLVSGDCTVLAVDLMRHSNRAPRGAMDLLFARLIQWAKVQGFQDFSFGMSPLKGTASVSDHYTHRGSWPILAGLLDRKGERFYNFRGLRAFKEKWHPSWTPRYLLVPARHHALSALVASTWAICFARAKQFD